MSFRDDERGQSVQIGMAILLAFIVLAMATYQASVVPDQNRQVEYNHNQRVQSQMADLRSTVVSVPGGGSGGSVTVQLGTTYPERTFFVNPGPPTGQLRTSPPGNLSITNATAPAAETDDFWDGNAHNYSTRALVYRPNYHVLPQEPATVYENTVLYDQYRSADVVATDQKLIDGNTITLVTLDGEYQAASMEARSIDLAAVSTSTETITVTDDAGPITIVLPTGLDASKWQTLLDGQKNVKNVTAGPRDDTVAITLVAGVRYRLRMAKVGVGTDVQDPGPAYVTTQGAGGKSIPENTSTEVVVEVRDEFNNPVAGVGVNATTERPNSSVHAVPDNVTDADGQVTLVYEAPPDVSASQVTDRINVSFATSATNASTFDASAPENAALPMTVRDDDGGGSASSALAWNTSAIANETGVVGCSAGTCTYNLSRDGDDTLPVSVETSPTKAFLSVDYTADNASIVNNLDPSEGTTDGNGENTTQAEIATTGTVNLTAYSAAGSPQLTVKVIGTGASPPSISSFTAQNPSGKQIEVSFDSSEPLSAITVDIEDSGGTVVRTLTRGDFTESCSGGTCTYTGSVNAPSDGTYTAVLTQAEDAGGDDGASGQSDSVTVSTSGPSISNPTATDVTDPDGTAGDYVVNGGDEIRITADVSDPSGVSTVTADASDFGGPSSLELTDGNGDGVYDSTTTVDESGAAADGNYTITVTATDSTGKTSTAPTNEMELDTTAPTISNFQATNPSGQTIDVSFDSDESLSAISVGIDDSGGSPVTTLTESDFTETCSSGTCTYASNYTVGSDGDYTAELTTARDVTGNDGASGQSSTVTVDTDTASPAITSASITNAPINDSDAGTKQTVTVNFNETMNQTVAPTVEITDLSGSPYAVSGSWDDATTWSGTVTINDDNEETAARISVGDAEDVAGNVQSPNPDTSNTFQVDTLVPSISNFQATNPSGRTIRVTFDANEVLSNITVNLTASDGTVVATLTEADFNDCSSGTCSYVANYPVSKYGRYTATLLTAEDAAGNDGAAGQSDRVRVTATSYVNEFDDNLAPSDETYENGTIPPATAEGDVENLGRAMANDGQFSYVDEEDTNPGNGRVKANINVGMAVRSVPAAFNQTIQIKYRINSSSEDVENFVITPVYANGTTIDNSYTLSAVTQGTIHTINISLSQKERQYLNQSGALYFLVEDKTSDDRTYTFYDFFYVRVLSG